MRCALPSLPLPQEFLLLSRPRPCSPPCTSCNLYPLCRFLRPPQLLHNSFGEAKSIPRTKCIQQHLRDYPLARSGRCPKRVRETTTLFIARRGWIIHRPEPLFPLLLRKQKKEVHLIGVINEILMKCATYGAGWKIAAHIESAEMGFFPQSCRCKLWLLLFLRRRSEILVVVGVAGNRLGRNSNCGTTIRSPLARSQTRGLSLIEAISRAAISVQSKKMNSNGNSESKNFD